MSASPLRRKTLEVPRYPDLSYEIPLWASGCLAGIDEAGRGAWAGPVYAAAVVLPIDPGLCSRLPGVRDSKQMTVLQRRTWAEAIKNCALAWAVASASNEEIDAVGILPATRLAMERAVAGLSMRPCSLLVDAVQLPNIPLPQVALVHGDALSLSIASASVLAKTARDEVMIALSEEYPAYGFEHNKGYGVKYHQEAILKSGVCRLHRRSYAPIRCFLETGRLYVESQPAESDNEAEA